MHLQVEFSTQQVGEFSFYDNENDILQTMLIINHLIMRILVFSYVQTRFKEIDILNKLRTKFPNKSDAELIAQFGTDGEKVENLFFNQLRPKQ